MTVCNIESDASVLIDTLEQTNKNTECDECNVVDLLLQESYERACNEKHEDSKWKQLISNEIDSENSNKVENIQEVFDKDCSTLENGKNIVTKELINVNRVDIEQCLNDIIDQVHKNLDNKKNKNMTREFETEDELPLKGFTKKKATPNNTANPDTSTKVEDIIKNKDISGTNSVTINHISIHNSETHIHVFSEPKPTNNPSVNRKRKLYSPKLQQINRENSREENLLITKLESDDEAPKEGNKFYQRGDGEGKTKFNVPSKKRNSSKQVDPPSPRTVLKNKKFDQLKKKQDNDDNKVIYADKKDCNVFDYTSDSDYDEESSKKLNVCIAKKKTVSTNRISAAHRNKPMVNNKTKRKKNTVNEKESTVPKRKLAVKKNKFFVSKVESKEKDLVDEKMRSQTTTLDTSFEFKKPTVVNEYPPPASNEIPEMEFAIDNSNSEDTFSKKSKPANKSTTASKRKISQKDSVVSTKNAKLSSNNLDKTESPLPELTVEPILSHKDKNLDESIVISETVLESFKRGLLQKVIINYPNKQTSKETETKPYENINQSMSVSNESLANESSEDIDASRHTISYTKTKSGRPKNRSKQPINEQFNSKTSVDQFELTSFNSVKAHCDSNDSPLNTSKVIDTSPRRLDEYDDASKEYYREMINIIDDNDENPIFKERRNSAATEILEPAEEVSKDVISDVNKKSESDKSSDKGKFEYSKDPLVSLTRMSTDDMSKWLQSSNCSSINTILSKTSQSSPNKQRMLNNETKIDEIDIQPGASLGLLRNGRSMHENKKHLSSKSSSISAGSSKKSDESVKKNTQASGSKPLESLKKDRNKNVLEISATTSDNSENIITKMRNYVRFRNERNRERKEGVIVSPKTTSTPKASEIINLSKTQDTQISSNEEIQNLPCDIYEWKKKNESTSTEGNEMYLYMLILALSVCTYIYY